jgi:hypothetical protein
MIGDEYQPYIRCRKPGKGVPHVMIHSGFYALRGANEDWNREGKVTLLLERDCFERGQPTESLVEALCRKFPGEMSLGGEPHLRDLVTGVERTLA